MRRASLLLIVLILFALDLPIGSMNGCGGGLPPVNHILARRFQHVVIIVQGNRRPDNLFHDPALTKAGADIAMSGTNSLDKSIELTPTSLNVNYDLSRAHSAFVAMYNKGKMNGANQVVCQGQGCESTLNPQFKYVNPWEVQPYFQMVEQYTFGDRMFQNTAGSQFPAHKFIISGTSAPSPSSRFYS